MCVCNKIVLINEIININYPAKKIRIIPKKKEGQITIKNIRSDTHLKFWYHTKPNCVL